MLRELEQMMCVVLLRQRVCSSWRRDSSRGSRGGWDLTAVFNNPKSIETDVSQEPTTKGQKLRGQDRHKNLQEGNLQLDTGKEKFTMKGVKPWNKSHERR